VLVARSGGAAQYGARGGDDEGRIVVRFLNTLFC
jgi:hypothetical protein